MWHLIVPVLLIFLVYACKSQHEHTCDTEGVVGTHKLPPLHAGYTYATGRVGHQPSSLYKLTLNIPEKEVTYSSTPQTIILEIYGVHVLSFLRVFPQTF